MGRPGSRRRLRHALRVDTSRRRADPDLVRRLADAASSSTPTPGLRRRSPAYAVAVALVVLVVCGVVYGAVTGWRRIVRSRAGSTRRGSLR